MSLEDQGVTGAVDPTQTTTGAPAAPDPVQGKPDPSSQGGGVAEGKKPEPSLAEGGGEPDDRAKTEPAWRDDWRERLAGGDEGFLKHLKRYTSPENYAKAGYEAQQRIRQGAVKEPLPEKPTDEQLAAWRKDNGIPETPDGYKIEPGDGLVFGEADKPGLDFLRERAHALNWTPQQLNQSAAIAAEISERNRAAQDAADQQFRSETQDVLHEMWGRDRRNTITHIENFLAAGTSPEFQKQLFGGRTADGRMIGDHPMILEMFHKLARAENPWGTAVPAGVSDPGKWGADRIKELNTMMADNHGPYWKGDDAAKLQQEYRDLITARDKSAKRS